MNKEDEKEYYLSFSLDYTGLALLTKLLLLGSKAWGNSGVLDEEAREELRLFVMDFLTGIKFETGIDFILEDFGLNENTWLG